MTEKLLQFIWQFQYLNTGELRTTAGEPVRVIHPGQLNQHQGPDFFNGRVRIGDTEWAGHIELHMKSSEWYRHRHHTDPGYGKVILHVVWQHDAEVDDENGMAIPVVEVQSRVSNLLLAQYEQWMNAPALIPCGAGIQHVDDLKWKHWLDRLLAERLLEKCSRISDQLERTGWHWEEICWRLVCTYFGGPVNKVSFQQVAESLPLKLLAKHKTIVTQLEALLLGQAGLLHKNFQDDYPKMLYREYQFLQKKYGLQVINKPPLYLRMRPTDFPSVRLAQLAMLIHTSTHLFSRFTECGSLKDATKMLEVTANDYWHYHYKPDVAAEYRPKNTGKSLAERVLTNAVIPVLFSYGHHQGKEDLRVKALAWLEQMPAEKNRFTQLFTGLGRPAQHAADSQAMLTLKQQYCDARRCLECAVGNHLLKQRQ
ncbi:MAG TPA: DUF2851 family protein [Phnomibacter sp.]|nr:DUF2851 family protein [Phnomibacter sp.]